MIYPTHEFDSPRALFGLIMTNHRKRVKPIESDKNQKKNKPTNNWKSYLWAFLRHYLEYIKMVFFLQKCN